MNAFRSLLFLAGLAVITPPFSFVALLICWLPRKWRYHVIGQWNRLTILLLRLCCGIRHEVRGLENLPPAPFVICANHQSAWETIAFYQIFPRASFVIKRSLLLIPFFGWGLYIAMEPIPIDRSAKMEALRRVLARGKEKMARGLAVVVFPQGHRIAAGTRAPFQPSAAMLATEAGAPLVAGRPQQRPLLARRRGRPRQAAGDHHRLGGPAAGDRRPPRARRQQGGRGLDHRRDGPHRRLRNGRLK